MPYQCFYWNSSCFRVGDHFSTPTRATHLLGVLEYFSLLNILSCSINLSYVVWNLYPGISIPVARTAAPCLSQYCSNSFSILRVNKREKLVFVKANFGQYWISNNEIRYWLQTCHINIAAVNCNFSSPLLNTSHIISLRWLRLALRK